MVKAKLLTLPGNARAVSVAHLRRRACASGLTQEAMGARIGTDAKGVRRLLAHGRKRADRLDLFFALELTNCHAPQPAAARACTEPSALERRCVQSWDETPQGEARGAVARRAA